MYKVALTGSVCSGKTLVAKNLELLGVPVFHADVIIKYLINNRIDVINALKTQFSEIFIGGLIDKSKITDEKFNRIINLIEFDMFVAFDNWCKKHEDKAYVVYESAIIFERKLNHAFDYTINVYAPKDERSFRFHRLNKDKYSETQIDRAMSKEYEEFNKNTEADYVIHNYDDLGLDNQISSVHNLLVGKHLNTSNSTKLTKVNI